MENFTLKTLWEIQKTYNGLFKDKNNVKDCLLGVFTELGELSNELEIHKYWKKNKKNDKEKILEEYTDTLMLLISLGINLGLSESEVLQQFKKKFRENIERQERGY